MIWGYHYFWLETIGWQIIATKPPVGHLVQWWLSKAILPNMLLGHRLGINEISNLPRTSTLPETNIFAPGWKTTVVSFWDGLVSEAILVSGSVESHWTRVLKWQCIYTYGKTSPLSDVLKLFIPEMGTTVGGKPYFFVILCLWLSTTWIHYHEIQSPFCGWNTLPEPNIAHENPLVSL